MTYPYIRAAEAQETWVLSKRLRQQAGSFHRSCFANDTTNFHTSKRESQSANSFAHHCAYENGHPGQLVHPFNCSQSRRQQYFSGRGRSQFNRCGLMILRAAFFAPSLTRALHIRFQQRRLYMVSRPYIPRKSMAMMRYIHFKAKRRSSKSFRKSCGGGGLSTR